jgi:hypothetical protein
MAIKVKAVILDSENSVFHSLKVDSFDKKQCMRALKDLTDGVVDLNPSTVMAEDSQSFLCQSEGQCTQDVLFVKQMHVSK